MTHLNIGYRPLIYGVLVLVLIAVTYMSTGPAGNALIADTNLSGDSANGLKLLRIAGCYACHTDQDNGQPDYAGGLKLETEFGTFYSPNITPDPKTGIGGWSIQDLDRALRHGRNPANAPYYPLFPYTSYNGLTDHDVADIYAALIKLKPVEQANKTHDLKFPFSFRYGLRFWQLLFFDTYSDSQRQSLAENRGQYLVNNVVHCIECHTPRNKFGALKYSKQLSGNDNLPNNNASPDIRAEAISAMGYTRDDLQTMLEFGMLPDGDFVGGSMSEVIDISTSYMPAEDLQAIITYLLSGNSGDKR